MAPVEARHVTPALIHSSYRRTIALVFALKIQLTIKLVISASNKFKIVNNKVVLNV